MRYIMGIDGGGTKTLCVIVDENGRFISGGKSLGSNHQTVGIDTALERIQSSINEALMKAGLDAKDISFCQYGLAGADRDIDFSILRPALAALPFSRWDLVCDTYEGLRAGTEDNVGVVLICGTGTNAVGRNLAGETVQVGGIGGYLYGDAAGGSFLAQEAFRAAVRSWEGRIEDSILPQVISDYFQQPSFEVLLNDFLDRNVTNVPNDLAIVLHQTAEKGDAVSIRILQECGKELGLAARAVVRRIGHFPEKIPVVAVGSIFQKGKSEHLLASLKECMTAEFPGMYITVPKLEPVFGSVLLGMDALGITVTPEMYDLFKEVGQLL
jgi:N-acetylglucosamine kinase-like BadF-type ATPase